MTSNVISFDRRAGKESITYTGIKHKVSLKEHKIDTRLLRSAYLTIRNLSAEQRRSVSVLSPLSVIADYFGFTSLQNKIAAWVRDDITLNSLGSDLEVRQIIKNAADLSDEWEYR